MKKIKENYMKKKFILFLLLPLLACSVFAISLSELRIVAEDGTFLGTFENEYSKNSIYNEYGSYGSKYSTNMATTALITLIIVHSTNMPTMHLGLWTEREIITAVCLLTNMQKESQTTHIN